MDYLVTGLSIVISGRKISNFHGGSDLEALATLSSEGETELQAAEGRKKISPNLRKPDQVSDKIIVCLFNGLGGNRLVRGDYQYLYIL